MQMLFDGSDESPDVAGLGIVAGRVTRLPRHGAAAADGLEHARRRRRVRVLGAGLPDPAWLYFVHSFAPEPADDAVVAAWCDYGRRFAAAIEVGPVWATQFHPEKSGESACSCCGNFVDGAAAASADGPLSRRSTCATARSCGCSSGDYDRADGLRRRPGRGRARVRRRRRALDPRRRPRRRAARRQPESRRSSKRSAPTCRARVQTGGGVRSRRRRAATRFAAGVDARRHRQRRGRAPRARRRARRVAPGAGRGRARRARPRRRDPRLDRRDRRSISSASRERFDRPGVGALVVTDISRDGMLERPRARSARGRRSPRSTVPVIASGGVADRRRPARARRVRGRRPAPRRRRSSAARSTRTRFTVEEGIAACSPSA